jgi:hypothetical protein
LAVVVGADGALDVAGKLDERAGNATGHFLFLANASDVIDVLGKVIDFDGAAELLGAAGEEGAVSGRISEGADIGIGEDAVERRVIVAVGLPREDRTVGQVSTLFSHGANRGVFGIDNRDNVSQVFTKTNCGVNKSLGHSVVNFLSSDCGLEQSFGDECLNGVH